jgi:ankyrin repeat protein
MLSQPACEDILKHCILSYCSFEFLLVSKNWRRLAKRLTIYDKRMTAIVVQNAIVSAAGCGDLEFLKLLLTHKRATPNGQSCEALVVAVRNNHIEVVKYLLTLPGVSATMQRTTKVPLVAAVNRRESAVQVAERCGNKEMIKLFKERGDL